MSAGWQISSNKLLTGSKAMPLSCYQYQFSFVWPTTSQLYLVTLTEQADHAPFVDLARFIGLECSAQQALAAWNALRYADAPGDYTTYGLPEGTLEMMNATMSFLLPVPMLTRWGLAPTGL